MCMIRQRHRLSIFTWPGLAGLAVPARSFSSPEGPTRPGRTAAPGGSGVDLGEIDAAYAMASDLRGLGQQIEEGVDHFWVQLRLDP